MKIEKRTYEVSYKGKRYEFPVLVSLGSFQREKVGVKKRMGDTNQQMPCECYEKIRMSRFEN